MENTQGFLDNHTYAGTRIHYIFMYFNPMCNWSNQPNKMRVPIVAILSIIGSCIDAAADDVVEVVVWLVAGWVH